MRKGIVAGLVAGAAGTAALNIATYADMAIRGRAASEVPEKLAGTLVETVGIDLDGEGKQAKETGKNRRSAIGALLGYATGLGMGAAYALARPNTVSIPVAGILVGLSTMAASDVPAIVSGATDPATWGTSGWLWDTAFHLVFGVTTVVTYEALVD
ncbi:MAG: hypothetical protein NVS4B8_07400 [Herpetosiphon sp.]